MLWRIRGGPYSGYSEKQELWEMTRCELCFSTSGGMLKLVVLRSLILGYLSFLFLKVIECKGKSFSLRLFFFSFWWFGFLMKQNVSYIQMNDTCARTVYTCEWNLCVCCMYKRKIHNVLYIHTKDTYTHAVLTWKRYICMCCASHEQCMYTCSEYTGEVHLHVLCMYERAYVCAGICIRKIHLEGNWSGMT